MIKNELLFVVEREIEVHIWKVVYYQVIHIIFAFLPPAQYRASLQVIEMLKAAYFDTENTTEASRKSLKKCLHNLFEEGADYYNQLLTDLSECYRVDLERYYDALEPREIGDKGARMARVSAQKILLCLGDLARYKEQVNSTTNYGRARQFYAKANHLEMRNARPFNMLAILAKISNRKFEAVYYHARLFSSH